MRKTMIGALTAAVTVCAQPSQAYEGPWCAYMLAGRDFYTSRCDLPNYEACRAEMAGLPGTWCTENPRFPGYYARQSTKVKKRKRAR
jgi:hypothetical protein